MESELHPELHGALSAIGKGVTLKQEQIIKAYIVALEMALGPERIDGPRDLVWDILGGRNA